MKLQQYAEAAKLSQHLGNTREFCTELTVFFLYQSTFLQDFGKRQERASDSFAQTWKNWTLNDFVQWMKTIRNGYYTKYVQNVETFYQKSG